jgi:hypothetical protein
VKDVDLAIKQGEAHGVPMRVGGAAGDEAGSYRICIGERADADI